MTMYIRIYVYSNIHKFDILEGANFEYAVTSNLAATDPLPSARVMGGQEGHQQGERRAHRRRPFDYCIFLHNKTRDHTEMDA